MACVYFSCGDYHVIITRQMFAFTCSKTVVVTNRMKKVKQTFYPEIIWSASPECTTLMALPAGWWRIERQSPLPTDAMNVVVCTSTPPPFGAMSSSTGDLITLHFQFERKDTGTYERSSLENLVGAQRRVQARKMTVTLKHGR